MHREVFPQRDELFLVDIQSSGLCKAVGLFLWEQLSLLIDMYMYMYATDWYVLVCHWLWQKGRRRAVVSHFKPAQPPVCADDFWRLHVNYLTYTVDKKKKRKKTWTRNFRTKKIIVYSAFNFSQTLCDFKKIDFWSDWAQIFRKDSLCQPLAPNFFFCGVIREVRESHFTDRITHRQSVKLIRNLEFRESFAELYVHVQRTPW